MDLPVRKKLPHTIPQWVAEGSWFFITIKCVPRRKNQLCRTGIGDAVLAAIKHNHEKLAWNCRLCLLMPDHLHAIFAFPRELGMQTVIKNWKKYVAGKHGVNWQRDFFDHRLREHSRSGREDGLHPDESRPQRLLRTGGGLDVDLSARRPSASAARVGLRRAEDCPPYLDATIGVAWVGRVTPCAPLWTGCES